MTLKWHILRFRGRKLCPCPRPYLTLEPRKNFYFGRTQIKIQKIPFFFAPPKCVPELEFFPTSFTLSKIDNSLKMALDKLDDISTNCHKENMKKTDFCV